MLKINERQIQTENTAINKQLCFIHFLVLNKVDVDLYKGKQKIKIEH